ncbi:MAG: tRNA epoxyqueuosine(34) reductase QueG [Planctomycetaceae bacterium]|jgi:epoxyqueuosine reductase|nr:tRNA epoxyqueuosine(34) reductase QueG [Planctomycetaceae bacterium]
MTFSQKIEQLKTFAYEIGINKVGVCRAEAAASYPFFERWLDEKKHGDVSVGVEDAKSSVNRGMTYLLRRREARKHPNSILRNVKSLMIVALNYDSVNPPTQTTPTLSQPEQFGVVAEYARGCDYHDVVRAKLKRLEQKHRELFPEAASRIVADSAPILEREYALRAGLGRLGRNTLLLNEQCGSRFFLGVLLSTAEFYAEDLQQKNAEMPLSCLPREKSCEHCGRCVAACPIGALDEPYQLDARKCLNYWLIEFTGNEIPSAIRQRVGNRLFGCDTCASVCPFNQRNAKPSFAEISDEDLRRMSLRRQLEHGCLSIACIESLDEAAFHEQFFGTPIFRLGLTNLKRNADVVKENGLNVDFCD